LNVKGLLLALTALSIAAPAHALPTKLPPIEQCGGDAGFTKFRNALRAVVRRKDRDALLRMLSPKVLVNFGGAAGPEAFAQSWDFDPTSHGIWDQLEIMLRMGCARDGEVRLIPSLIRQLGPYSDDALYDARLSLPGAKLFKEPGAAADAVAVAPWTLVTATDTSSDFWTGVRLPDGSTGWMSDDDLYEPVGYRIVIERLRGKWMITAFVAGD
jgi:hypothetical protein